MQAPPTLVDSVARQLLADPDSDAALKALGVSAGTADPDIKDALATVIKDWSQHAEEVQPQLEELRKAEAALEAALNEALEQAATADPDGFGPRIRLRELVSKHDALIQQEQANPERAVAAA
jgi:hypothetical protein